MVIALVVFQFDAQRRALLEELKDQAVEHNILLNNVLKTVEDHVWRLGAWSEIYAVKDEARGCARSCRRRIPAISPMAGSCCTDAISRRAVMRRPITGSPRT